MFDGIYRDMQYTIQLIKHEQLGDYYDILLNIGNKQSRERELSLIRAFIRLSERIRAWDLEERDVLMTTEEATKLIEQWKEANRQLQALDTHSDEKAVKDLTSMILWTSIELGRAGYILNEDDTEWFHPSDAN